MAARRQVRRSVTLPAPPARVWRALTDGALLERWLAAEVELEARPGGRGWMREADGRERALRVDAVEPERRLALCWWSVGARGRHGAASVVEIDLAADGRGTRVTVTETDLADVEAGGAGRRPALAPGPASGGRPA